MTTKRNCRYVPLSKQPLVLVLCQVRFSPVRKMGDYIPAIQEEFRSIAARYADSDIDFEQKKVYMQAAGA
jgi:uncharacterized protein (TIGR04255 family)